MFDWEVREQAEYSRNSQISFVKLTKRSYLTASGTALKRTEDPIFLAKADAVVKLAKFISEGATAGIMIPGFKEYRPYPVQAVWRGDEFKIWLKQPLFIDESIYKKAVSQVELSEAVDFEQLAEGVEIQTITNGIVTQKVIDQLQQAVTKSGYQMTDSTSHRELYLDGLPVSDDKQILVRMAITTTGKQPSFAAVN